MRACYVQKSLGPVSGALMPRCTWRAGSRRRKWGCRNRRWAWRSAAWQRQLVAAMASPADTWEECFAVSIVLAVFYDAVLPLELTTVAAAAFCECTPHSAGHLDQTRWRARSW